MLLRLALPSLATIFPVCHLLPDLAYHRFCHITKLFLFSEINQSFPYSLRGLYYCYMAVPLHKCFKNSPMLSSMVLKALWCFLQPLATVPRSRAEGSHRQRCSAVQAGPWCCGPYSQNPSRPGSRSPLHVLKLDKTPFKNRL